MNNVERTPEVEEAAPAAERRNRDLPRVDRGEASSQDLAQQLKPLLVGAAIAAGTVAVVGVALAIRRNRRARWVGPAQPSALGTLARNVGFGLLRLAARQAASAFLERFAPASTAPGSVAVSPNQVQR
jgi:hypothetical protein